MLQGLTILVTLEKHIEKRGRCMSSVGVGHSAHSGCPYEPVELVVSERSTGPQHPLVLHHHPTQRYEGQVTQTRVHFATEAVKNKFEVCEDERV